jgi:hypothetical protein
MQFTITPEDAQNAQDFLNTTQCLIATALKRQFPGSEIGVGGYSFNINKEEYRIADNLRAFVRKAYAFDGPHATRKKPVVKKAATFECQN